MTTPAPTTPVEALALMNSILQRIATGPEMSKDLSREDACAGMRCVLEGRVDPVQAGVFLIALRMKRETDEENRGVLDAILEATRTVVAPVDELVQIGDPYDGYNRTLPASPFLPAVLAACGVAAVSQGVERMGPKYGVTHRQVLRAAGLPVEDGPEAAAARLADPQIGWAYVDQKAFCPGLYALAALRALIVKRPVITTTEVLARPLQGRVKTHLVTGYVHKPYARVYALLARHAGFDSALLVRGVEGGVIPSLSQGGKVFRYVDGGEEQPVEFRPNDLGIDQAARAALIPDDAMPGATSTGGAVPDVGAIARAAAAAGMAALAGQRGPTHDSLVYGAALCLWHLGRHDTLPAAADAVRGVLARGEALRRVQAA